MELNPLSKSAQIKPRFEERYKSLLGAEYDKFLSYSFSYIRKAIRVNTLKISVKEVQDRLKDLWQLDPVPWCKEGFWISYKKGKRFDIGNLQEHQLGYVYVQEAASMIPPVVLAPKPGEVVLDLCAAPGSKTSQIAMYMRNEGILVANDVEFSRLKALGLNLQRCGVANTLITHMQGMGFRVLPPIFDKVLVDAPCSGTGTIRKSLKTLEMWNPKMIGHLAKIQKLLLETGFSVLKPGGVLVYSTCTLEPEENEGVVSDFLNAHSDAQLQAFSLDIKRNQPVTEFLDQTYHKDVSKCLRIFPHDNDTEGFFIAKISKMSKK